MSNFKLGPKNCWLENQFYDYSMDSTFVFDKSL